MNSFLDLSQVSSILWVLTCPDCSIIKTRDWELLFKHSCVEPFSFWYALNIIFSKLNEWMNKWMCQALLFILVFELCIGIWIIVYRLYSSCIQFVKRLIEVERHEMYLLKSAMHFACNYTHLFKHFLKDRNSSNIVKGKWLGTLDPFYLGPDKWSLTWRPWTISGVWLWKYITFKVKRLYCCRL